MTSVPALMGAPSERSRLIRCKSPAHEALYNWEASDSFSLVDRTGDDTTAESARGDLGGEEEGGVMLGLVCRDCGREVVGECGGLQCDVACWNGGGSYSSQDVDRPRVLVHGIWPCHKAPLQPISLMSNTLAIMETLTVFGDDR